MAETATATRELSEEYEGIARVFLIEDGERHYYAAASSAQALTEHDNLMEPDEWRQLHIEMLAPDHLITVHFPSTGDMAGFPAHWPRGRNRGGDPTVMATAAEWAEHYAQHLPYQVSSTCF